MKHPLDPFYLKDFMDGIEAVLLDPKIRSCTVFCAPLKNVKHRVRVTRRDSKSLIVTYGVPNWGEREFLRLCKKAKTNPRRLRFTFFKQK